MRKPSLATALAGISLFVSLGGTSIAASHYLITSKSQIAPSVRRALRGNRGPRGRAGASGSQGVEGQQGTQGASGHFSWAGSQVVESDPVQLTTDNPTTNVGVNCPSGMVAIVGGYDGFNEGVTDSVPNSNPPAHGWTVYAHLDTTQIPQDQTGQVQAWAECVSGNG